MNGDSELKQPSDRKQACDKVDLSKVHSSDSRSRVALSVADMPRDLGELLDRGLEDHFRDRLHEISLCLVSVQGGGGAE